MDGKERHETDFEQKVKTLNLEELIALRNYMLRNTDVLTEQLKVVCDLIAESRDVRARVMPPEGPSGEPHGN